MREYSFLSSEEELRLLADMPLESKFRAVPPDRVASRLRTERSLFDGAFLTNDLAAPWLTAVVVADNNGDAPLAATLASLALQSCMGVRCLVIAGTSGREALIDFISKVRIRPKSIEVFACIDDSAKRQMRKARYVCFLRQGDQLHPSAAAWLAIGASHDSAAEVVTWGELQPGPDGELLWAQRNPSLERETLLHYPYLRNAFAVSSKLAVAYPGDLGQELVSNGLHLFQIWLAHQQGTTWTAHPEYFLIRAVARASQKPEAEAHSAFVGHEEDYRRLFAEIVRDLELESLPHDAASPYRLVPIDAPGAVSVVILFRDKPELTLKAVASVARQNYRGFLEIILVNNQSISESRECVVAGLRKFEGKVTCRVLDFDRPFNHSEQCNVGVREALGDVILLLNNDCELLSEHAVRHLSSWAVRPGVASVGLAVRDPITGKTAAGMEARLDPTNYFDSMVEERSDPAFTPFVRRCFGNTFACAAISRSVFAMAGGLDAARFPNGYNDVEFACRTRALGLHHLVLGHIVASHSPGQSRARTDESPQKILLRTLYPQAAGAAVTVLGFDAGLMRLARKSATPPRTR